MVRIFPPRNLPGAAEKWGREVEGRVIDLESKQERDASKLNNSLRNSSGQLAVLARQIDALSETATRVEDASKLYEAFESREYSWPGGSNVGWYPYTPTVTASSLSGRFRVTVVGSIRDGSAYATFSAPGYPRNRIVDDTPSAALDRVSVLGAFANGGSSLGSWLVSYAPGESVTFTGQMMLSSSYEIIAKGVRLQVEPLL